MFVEIVENLLPRFPNIDKDVDEVFKGQRVWPETGEYAAALGYKVFQRLVNERQEKTRMLSATASNALHRAQTEGILEFFLDPLYYYVDEQLDSQGVILALLMRYKHRSEWFYRKQLWDKSQEKDESTTRNWVEKPLAEDLYAYLYDQGIDFHIEPSSMPGAIDLIAAQGTDDPLLLDAKVFDNENHNKHYLCKGFYQIYTYTQQYNEPVGYLVIYNITELELRFSLESSGRIPMVRHNNKTIFLLTINIPRNLKSPSKRGVLKPIEITENELVRRV